MSGDGRARRRSWSPATWATSARAWSSTFARRDPDARLLGLDTGFFAHYLTGTTLLPERRLDCQFFGDVRAVPAEALDGVDGVVHLAGVSNDPIGTSFEAATLECQPPRHRLARPRREGGRRPQLRLRLQLQRLRPRRGRAAHGGVRDGAADGLRDLEAAGRAGRSPSWPTSSSRSRASASRPPAE